MDKRSLRRYIAEKKRALSPAVIEAAGERLAGRLCALPEYQQAQTLFCTLSINQEVPTRPIIERAWRDGKRVAVPKIIRKDMVFLPIRDWDGLTPGAMGIPEPAGSDPLAPDERTLILVPGLGFDRRGHRVGYGGGYYDRFLAAYPGCATVALCYGFQYCDSLATEPHDIPIRKVLFDTLT